MASHAILLEYQEPLVALHAAASQLKLAQIVALAITALFVLVFLFLLRRSVPLPSALLPLPLAVYSATIYKTRNTRLRKTPHLKTSYERGIARITGKWPGAGIKGDGFIPEDHTYGGDLTIFGEGSLFELLCTCRTEVGQRQLVSLEGTLKRQAAIQELQDTGFSGRKIEIPGGDGSYPACLESTYREPHGTIPDR